MTSTNETIDEMMETSENSKVSSQFSDVLENLQNLRSQVTVAINQVKNLEKETNKIKRQAEKDKNERKRQKQNKKPSGFALPTKISDELCLFMNKEVNTMVARTDVTRFIIDYIKSNDLQNPENKKIIIPDDKLKCLLHLEETDVLSFFNLQKYMNCHFHKKGQNTSC